VVFHNQTRAVIYDSVLNPQDYGGKPLSFKDAADYVRGQQSRLAEASQKPQEIATTEKDAQAQQLAAQELKQQATASPTGEIQTQRNVAQDVQELKRLQMATRLGDPDALAIRLANVEHIKKSEEEAS
jgi:hypothetical protein